MYGYYDSLLLETAAATPPALLSSLTDDFNDNTIDTVKWSANYGTVAETGGKAQVTFGTGYSGWKTGSVWTFDAALAEIVIPATGTNDMSFAVGSADTAAGTEVGFYYTGSDGKLYFVNAVGYFDAGAPSVTYSATTHKRLRVQLVGSNVVWSTSPDGTNWTTQRTLTKPSWLPSDHCFLYFEGHRASGSATGTMDNFNLPPVPSAAPNGIGVPTATGVPASSILAAAPAGIAATAGCGTPTVALNLATAPSGVTSPSAAGTPTAGLLVASPSGIPVTSGTGSLTVTVGLSASPGGIAVPVSPGQPAGPGATPVPIGVAVPATTGTQAVAILGCAPVGASAVAATGTPTAALNRSAGPAGIAVGAAPGSPLSGVLAAFPSGIPVSAAAGSLTVVVSATAAPSGITVAISLGQPGSGPPLSRYVTRPYRGAVTRPDRGKVTRP